MSKEYDLTEEQFYKHMIRYTRAIVTVDIVIFVVVVGYSLYLFFKDQGLLRNYHIAHFLSGAFFFAWLRNIFSSPKRILLRRKKYVQFRPQWVSLCYEQLPQKLKNIINQKCSKKPGLQPTEALLHIANILNLISHAFAVASLLCLVIGLYRFYENLQSLDVIKFFQDCERILETVSMS